MPQWPIHTLHFVLYRQGDIVVKQCRTRSSAAQYGGALRQEAERMRGASGALFPRYLGYLDGPLPGVRMEYVAGGPLQPLQVFDLRALERETARVLARALHMARELERAGILYWDFRLANLIGGPNDFRMIDFTGAEMPGCPLFTRGRAFHGPAGVRLWEQLGCTPLRRIAALRALALELLGIPDSGQAPTPALRAFLEQGARPAAGLTAEEWLALLD